MDYTYGMMIDDDVPLPPDLHVPLLTLSRQEEIKARARGTVACVCCLRVELLESFCEVSSFTSVVSFLLMQAVSYVICAATENGDFNSLVALQDAEYKLAVRSVLVILFCCSLNTLCVWPS